MAIGTGEGAPVRHDVSGTVLSEWPATVAAVGLSGECVVLRLVGGVDADHAREVAGLVPALGAIEAAEVEADLVGHARTMGDGWRLALEWGSDEDAGSLALPCRWSGSAWRVQTYGARHDPQLTLRPHLLGALVGLDVPALVGLRGRDVRVTLRGAQLTLDEAVAETEGRGARADVQRAAARLRQRIAGIGGGTVTLSTDGVAQRVTVIAPGLGSRRE